MASLEGDLALAYSNLPFSVLEISGDPIISKIHLQRVDDGQSPPLCHIVVHSTHEYAQSHVDAFGSSSTAARIGGAKSGAGGTGTYMEMAPSPLLVLLLN